MRKIIPVYEPFVSKNQKKYIDDCLKTNWISSQGKYIEIFEREFAKYVGSKYAVTTNSGTSALHLALASLGIGPGDEVIIPAFTMVATAFAVMYVGAKPILVDCEADTFNIDPNKIEKKITKKTKAIIPVHLYGHPCDMDLILKIARKYKLLVVEDAAEAHGAEYKSKKVGSIGDIGCFSFYGNKIITTGEGGMLVTNSKKIHEKAKSLKNMAFGEGINKFKHLNIGFNYRMTNIQAALGLAQLEQIEKIIIKKRLIASKYKKYLGDVRNIILPIERKCAKNVYWMYAIQLQKKTNKIIITELLKQGIESRPFFTPVHLQPIFKKMNLFTNEKYPIAEKISKNGLYLPSGVTLKDSEIKYICNTLNKIV